MSFVWCMILALAAIADVGLLVFVCFRRFRMRRSRTERMYHSLALAIRRELQQVPPVPPGTPSVAPSALG